MDFPTYYLVCLHENCSQEAADFMASSLSKPVEEGGAELIVRQEKMNENSDGLVLHISASPDKLYQIAESIELKLKDNDEVIRPFIAKEVHAFPQSGFVGPLTLAEAHKCILYAMELVHLDRETRTLPGHSTVKVMKGAPLLDSYQEAGLIDMFPLHDDEMLRKLHATWTKSPLLEPPIQDIRDYFGENVALYISFTAYYTRFLVPMAFLGILHYCLDRFVRLDFIYNNVLFACLNLVAVTVFLEFWKRRSNEHAFFFGTSGKLRHKKPRAAFRGEYRIDEVTGRPEVYYPMKETVKTILFLSVPLTSICLALAFAMMLLSFESERMMTEFLLDPETGAPFEDLFSQGLAYVPSVFYSVLVTVMNLKYLHLAHWLTEKENHRTQDQFEKHVVLKLVIFEFVNTFLALFYIGFYLQDIKQLKQCLVTMLIVTQIVNQVQETVLPILLKKPSSRRLMNKIAKKVHIEGKKTSVQCKHKIVECLDCINEDDKEIGHAMFSLKKDPYESTYDDFMELWLQFGHVFLFSSVYPLAAFFALINNFLELKLYVYKACKLMRKPTPRSSRDIGAWYMAFSITSIISVMTNLTLLAMDKDVQDFAPYSSSRDWVLLFVAIEHIFLLIRFIIEISIPDVSAKVKKAQDINEFKLRGF